MTSGLSRSARFARSPRLLALVVLCLALAAAVHFVTPRESFRIDPARSTPPSAVGKAGVLSFRGHTHEVAVPAATARSRSTRYDTARSPCGSRSTRRA